jgi:hypothetical protein
MALPIASIPVLTGEVAEKFEAEAQKNYEAYLSRTVEEQQTIHEQYQRGMEIVRKVHANSRIKR